MNLDYKVSFSPKAEEDIEKAIEWYEDRILGLGRSFEGELNERILDLQRNPFICQKIKGEIRAAHLQRFPFSIFYWCSNNHLGPVFNVIAVLPQAGDPTKWQNRKM